MEDIKKIEQELKKNKEEVINCRKCPLFQERIKNNYYPVIGEGNHQAKIIFVGEGPGLQESKTGRPFCGAAGKILDELLESVNIKREDIYITNMVKCRPPKNRDPQEEEIEACVPYLERQIEIIKPEVICPLGRFAMEFLMEKFGLKEEIELISKVRGKVFEVKNIHPHAKRKEGGKGIESEKVFRYDVGVKIIPLYHPAVAIYNPNMKEILKKDFEILKRFKT